MSERLEILIRNKRKEFDQFEPPANLWDRIEVSLDEQKKKDQNRLKFTRITSALRIAAVLVLVTGAALVFARYQGNRPPEISAINPELARQQVHYASMIEERRAELSQVKTMDPALYSEFASELQKLDSNYEKLKQDLPSSPNQEETLKAMIRNLKAQADVLNQQLEIIQQIKQFKSQHNGNKTI
jgi:hypothetical protein